MSMLEVFNELMSNNVNHKKQLIKISVFLLHYQRFISFLLSSG